jgi:tRNA(fMet)-specific endonuclease VapC
MFLLDTNILLDYLNGIESTVNMANRLFSLISTSVIVKGELFHGVYMSARIDDNERLITELLDTINLISIDENTAVVYAKLKTAIYDRFGPKDRAKRRNFKIEFLGFKDNDLWIASTAIQHRLILVSSDSDMMRLHGVAGLRVENWS